MGRTRSAKFLHHPELLISDIFTTHWANERSLWCIRINDYFGRVALLLYLTSTQYTFSHSLDW